MKTRKLLRYTLSIHATDVTGSCYGFTYHGLTVGSFSGSGPHITVQDPISKGSGWSGLGRSLVLPLMECKDQHRKVSDSVSKRTKTKSSGKKTGKRSSRVTSTADTQRHDARLLKRLLLCKNS